MTRPWAQAVLGQVSLHSGKPVWCTSMRCECPAMLPYSFKSKLKAPAQQWQMSCCCTGVLCRVGSTSSSTGIIVESIRVYNYALPRLSQAKESLCADDGSCGRFLLAGWQPPAVDLVPAGAIDLHGVVPSVASTRISLQSNSYYLMVRDRQHSMNLQYPRVSPAQQSKLAAEGWKQQIASQRSCGVILWSV